MEENVWTHPSQIVRAGVKYLNGEYEEFIIHVAVCDAQNYPLWITHLDEAGFEVITPWSAIQSLTVLEHRRE